MSLHALFSSNKPGEPEPDKKPAPKKAEKNAPPARKIKKSLRAKGSRGLK